MEPTTDRVLPRPHVVATNEGPLTVADIESQWNKSGIRYTPEVALLFRRIAAERPVEGEFIVTCRSPHDYGYVGSVMRGYTGKIKSRVQKASLQFVYNKAQKEGLLLVTPRLLHELVVRKNKPVFGGQNCLVAMEPLRAHGGKLYLPRVRGIRKPDGTVTITVDMVGGNPFQECGRRQAVLFLGVIPD